MIQEGAAVQFQGANGVTMISFPEVITGTKEGHVDLAKVGKAHERNCAQLCRDLSMAV